ncbi:PREDICTED: dystrobrevin beta isoform X2 [Nicrophorus vespilloides]|uniref:Dystrobrevin beta isoform X2 n=1 Tax=Nicrophorus vespilloides TaxID=110193 RepID=A0ABM1MI47_NICVS|nr:PREDICTED: dystrobrevin beta isoform X2 [Nicrophorus vespilloides]
MQGQDAISGSSDHRLALVHEMSAHNFDLIRFASYRTAMKLRFIQKKVSLHALDIWNVIEAFREQGLHALEPTSELSVARLETLLCSLYHSLNKRAPPTQQAHVDVCSSLLLNWLLAAYATVDNVGKIRVFSIKVALATLCAGKLMDKLRYIFSQISDSNGLLLMWRFNEYLQEVLSLPAAVYESPTFNYSDSVSTTIFNPNAKVTVNDFLDIMMSDPGPPPLVWLPLLHRIGTVESVVHPIQCDACQKENFAGFRYRCQKCPHYNLCQDCFWRGRVSVPHTLDHNVKEYSSFSPTRTIGHSLRKSFRCVPDKPKNNLPRFPEQPEKPLNLSHIVPPSPLPSHNGFPDGNNFVPHYDGMGSLDSRSTARSLDSARDDEHRLIARYAAKLAQEQRSGMPRGGSLRKNSLSPDAGRVPSEACLGMDSTRAQRELISQLEAKNREIMREIARLRRQQELESSGGHGPENPALMNELRALRMRKDELETHLTTLQDSRRQLMIQLEGLMKMLKNHQSSPRSTPNSSPRSTKSPPLPPGAVPTTQAGPRSAPQTPLGHAPGQPMGSQQTSERSHSMVAALGGAGNTNSLDRSERGAHHNAAETSLAGVGGDVRNAFGGSSNINVGGSNGNGTPGSMGRSLRNDLLVAADSVTNAMSTLVRELNSEPSTLPGSSSIRKPLDFEDDGEDESDGGWQQELQRRYAQEANFMAELRARQATSPPEGNSAQNNQNFHNYPNQQPYHPPNYPQPYVNHQEFSRPNFTLQQGPMYPNQHNYSNQGPFASQPQFNDRRNSKEFSNTNEIQEGQEQRVDMPMSKETLEWEEALKNWVNR